MAGYIRHLKRYAMVLLHKLKFFIMMLGQYPLARNSFAAITLASSEADKSNPYGFLPTNIAQLPPRARQIYVDLKAAVEHRQKENG